MLFSSKKRVKKVKVKRIITITFPFSYFMLSGALCWSFILDSNSFYFHFHSLDFRHSGPLVWNFEFDEVDFFPSLNWIFTACVACKNSVQTRKKNQVHQTWNFKLENANVKSQVQIDRGQALLVFLRNKKKKSSHQLILWHSLRFSSKKNHKNYLSLFLLHTLQFSLLIFYFG